MEPHLYSWEEGEASIINPIPAVLSETAALPQEDELTAGFAILGILSTFPDSVPNLYERKPGHFLYHLTYGQVKVKADIPLTATSPQFEVKYIPGQFAELGINYFAKVQVGEDQSIIVRLMGGGSYDPAGVTMDSIGSECVREDVAAFLVVYASCLLKAAQYGATEDSLDRLREVNSAIMNKYFKRPLLLEWVTLQVRQVCYHQTVSIPYAEFLLQKANYGELDLSKPGQEHTKEYLERYSRWKVSMLPESKVFPSYQFYQVSAMQEFLRQRSIDEVEQFLGAEVCFTVTRLAKQKVPGQGLFLKYLPKNVPALRRDVKKGSNLKEMRETVERLEAGYRLQMQKASESLSVQLTLGQEESSCTSF